MTGGKLLGVLTALMIGVAAAADAPARAGEITIGTGSRAGVYYQVGRAICRLVNAGTPTHGVTCNALATDGSIFNLDSVRAGSLQLAVAQSDWQQHALNGTGPFGSAGPASELRALFSVHGEPFTLVARTDSGIRTLEDLKGKRVNIGNPGSGQRATMEVLMAALGWDKSIFSLANELPASQQSLALCHDRVQAMIYTVGHPNASVGQAAGLCDAIIVPVQGPAVDKLVAENAYYAHTEIPGGIYPGNPEPVPTFGVKATVVSSTKVDADSIYAVVKAVFDDLERFKSMHPAFGSLDAARMLTDGLSAPLHDGAIRYFTEKGLM